MRPAIGRSGTGPVTAFVPRPLGPAMHSTSRDAPATPAVTPEDHPPAAAVRTVYQAVRTLVPDAGTVDLDDLLAVTRLEPGPAVAAMDRLGRAGPLSIHRIVGGEPTWLVRRPDR